MRFVKTEKGEFIGRDKTVAAMARIFLGSVLIWRLSPMDITMGTGVRLF